MFKKLKKKVEDSAQKVVQQVSSPNTSQSSPAEGNLIDIEQPSTQSTPIPNKQGVENGGSSAANFKVSVAISDCIMVISECMSLLCVGG